MSQHITSIQVGLPQSFGVKGADDPMDRSWVTGFFKEPVQGEVWLGQMNLVGDGQADLKNHGGIDKAVLAYAAVHYPYWQEQLDLLSLPYGAFGENFTVVGQSESSVCIGDIYTVGDAQVQVSQPRQPCWKLSRRWRISDLAQQVKAGGRTGWYFRVIKEGTVAPGLELVLKDRFYPEWTVERANRVMYQERNNRQAAVELASCPLLANDWQKTLMKRGSSKKHES